LTSYLRRAEYTKDCAKVLVGKIRATDFAKGAFSLPFSGKGKLLSVCFSILAFSAS
jgi:hypothetical protein